MPKHIVCRLFISLIVCYHPKVNAESCHPPYRASSEVPDLACVWRGHLNLSWSLDQCVISCYAGLTVSVAWTLKNELYIIATRLTLPLNTDFPLFFVYIVYRAHVVVPAGNVPRFKVPASFRGFSTICILLNVFTPYGVCAVVWWGCSSVGNVQ